MGLLEPHCVPTGGKGPPTHTGPSLYLGAPGWTVVGRHLKEPSSPGLDSQPSAVEVGPALGECLRHSPQRRSAQ